MSAAVGMIEVVGLAAAMVVADAMTKAATVVVQPPARIGDGLVSIAVLGPVAEVIAAVATGRHVASRLGHISTSTVIGRLYPEVAGVFGFDVRPTDRPTGKEAAPTSM